MSTTREQLQSFTRFIDQQVADDGDAPLDELFFQWWGREHADEDRRAVEASIRDMEAGETGQLFSEFAAEFRKRNNLPESA